MASHPSPTLGKILGAHRGAPGEGTRENIGAQLAGVDIMTHPPAMFARVDMEDRSVEQRWNLS